MEPLPHAIPPHDVQRSVRCGVLTISDTRTSETDASGQSLQQALTESGHQVLVYDILPDDPGQIDSYLRQLAVADKIEAILCSGGTGIARRDVL